MQKTTAKVEYAPYGWIACRFCYVNFYGFRAKEMEKKWNNIKDERYNKYNSLFEENEKRIQDLCSKSSTLLNKVRESKPFYRFWYNKAEKQMLSEANELSSQADELEEKNKKVKDNRFFDAYECHSEIEDLLQQNGFVLTSFSSIGDKYVTKIELWTLEQ